MRKRKYYIKHVGAIMLITTPVITMTSCFGSKNKGDVTPDESDRNNYEHIRNDVNYIKSLFVDVELSIKEFDDQLGGQKQLSSELLADYKIDHSEISNINSDSSIRIALNSHNRYNQQKVEYTLDIIGSSKTNQGVAYNTSLKLYSSDNYFYGEHEQKVYEAYVNLGEVISNNDKQFHELLEILSVNESKFSEQSIQSIGINVSGSIECENISFFYQLIETKRVENEKMEFELKIIIRHDDTYISMNKDVKILSRNNYSNDLNETYQQLQNFRTNIGEIDYKGKKTWLELSKLQVNNDFELLNESILEKWGIDGLILPSNLNGVKLEYKVSRNLQNALDYEVLVLEIKFSKNEMSIYWDSNFNSQNLYPDYSKYIKEMAISKTGDTLQSTKSYTELKNYANSNSNSFGNVEVETIEEFALNHGVDKDIFFLPKENKVSIKFQYHKNSIYESNPIFPPYKHTFKVSIQYFYGKVPLTVYDINLLASDITEETNADMKDILLVKNKINSHFANLTYNPSIAINMSKSAIQAKLGQNKDYSSELFDYFGIDYKEIDSLNLNGVSVKINYSISNNVNGNMQYVVLYLELTKGSKKLVVNIKELETKFFTDTWETGDIYFAQHLLKFEAKKLTSHEIGRFSASNYKSLTWAVINGLCNSKTYYPFNPSNLDYELGSSDGNLPTTNYMFQVNLRTRSVDQMKREVILTAIDEYNYAYLRDKYALALKHFREFVWTDLLTLSHLETISKKYSEYSLLNSEKLFEIFNSDDVDYFFLNKFEKPFIFKTSMNSDNSGMIMYVKFDEGDHLTIEMTYIGH